jgi:hypothetical protein
MNLNVTNCMDTTDDNSVSKLIFTVHIFQGYIHTYTHSFTDPLSVKTGLDIELVMIEAGLQYAVKSIQYNTIVVKIKKSKINNRYCSQAYNR